MIEGRRPKTEEGRGLSTALGINFDGNCELCILFVRFQGYNGLADLTAVIKDGLENVIFLWSWRISETKKHIVLLISQKDYVHI